MTTQLTDKEREAMKQAIYDNFGVIAPKPYESIERIVLAVKVAGEQETCEWIHTPEPFGWVGACGFRLYENFSEKNWNHCPYCGGRIVIAGEQERNEQKEERK